MNNLDEDKLVSMDKKTIVLSDTKMIDNFNIYKVTVDDEEKVFHKYSFLK